MKLSVADRLIILSVLPQEGDITTLKILRQLKTDLSFSEEEHKLLKFRQEEDKLFFEENIVTDKEIELGEKATDIIANAFKELNNRKRLREEHIPLYEKFVETK